MTTLRNWIFGSAVVGAMVALAAVSDAAPNTFTHSANGHYWLKNGTPFVTIGYNRYDVWNATDPANDGLAATQYVQQMAAYGVNVIRVWAEQGDQNTTGDYYLEYPAGTYRPSQESRLDELFNAADQYGVYVMICPWDTFNIKSNFAQFAYNTANGGMITSYSQMVSSPAARPFIKNKIQYMYNRWGAHPSFFLWTFNEINILDTSNTDQMNFAQDIGAFIKSIDPFHPFTISYTGSGQGYVPLEQLSVIDGSDIHFYGAISGSGGAAKEYNTAINIGYLDCCGKPLVLSEWGVTHNANTADVVNALAWGSIGLGASGNGMIWTDRYDYGGITTPFLQIYQNLRNFVDSVAWGTFMDSHTASSSVQTSNHSVAAYASMNSSQAIVVLVARVGTNTGGTVTVSGLVAGSAHTVDIWTTYAGAKYATLMLTANPSGQLVINAPAIPTMQAIYIH